MHGFQGHVFTNEFDDLSIVISIDIGDASASMLVTISEPNCVWDELVPTTVDSLNHTDIQQTLLKANWRMK
jgi:hypothetical protein